MRQFKAQSWFHIKGRGHVVSVINDEDFEKDSHHLLGEQVSIDGVIYTVKGVEAYCLQTVRKGASIGLLVVDTDDNYAEECTE